MRMLMMRVKMAMIFFFAVTTLPAPGSAGSFWRSLQAACGVAPALPLRRAQLQLSWAWAAHPGPCSAKLRRSRRGRRRPARRVARNVRENLDIFNHVTLKLLLDFLCFYISKNVFSLKKV